MIVSAAAFAYLVLQRGELDRLRHDRAAWLKAYELALAQDCADLGEHLPPLCRRILDVGSGLGGGTVRTGRVG